MMKVISFGLWGNKPRYIEGAEANVVLARRFYPDWQYWFFCDESVPKETLSLLSKQKDCRVMVTNTKDTRQDRLFWRFWAASYEDVDVMIVRDTDSRIGQREQVAVNDWLNQGTSFHIMRDSPVHNVPMCGGMWGCRAHRLRNIRAAIEKYYDEGKHNTVLCGVDQDFLHQVVWPVAMHDCTEHDDFFAKKTFPYVPRHEKYYVGRVFEPVQSDYQQNTPKLRRETVTV